MAVGVSVIKRFSSALMRVGYRGLYYKPLQIRHLKKMNIFRSKL